MKIIVLILLFSMTLLLAKVRRKMNLYYITFIKKKPAKCWLHQANSIEKLKKYLLDYPGIEIDVFFNRKKMFFDVTHDKETSTNLSLEEYFKYFSNDKKIWLDFKNLTTENSEEALKILDKLLLKNKIDKSQVIIESSNFEELKKYKENGYYTTYYVLYHNSKKMSFDEKVLLKERIIKIIQTQNVSAISFSGNLYPIIKEFNIKIDLLVWEAGLTWQKLFLKKYKMKYKMLEDEQVKIFLVHED